MALTLKQHFSFSNLETLIFHGGFGSGNVNTNYDTCTFNCDKNIKTPPTEVVEIKQLRTIKFEFCPNLDLAETFLMLADIPNLRKLQLKSCNIKEVPPEIWALYKLKNLDFVNEGYGNENEFTTFPPEIGQLVELQELCLSENYKFERFPIEIANLKRLKKLNLRGFHRLPENIELITNLEDICLVFSHIVPNQIEYLLEKPNGLKSVTVGENYYNIFNQLTERYPTFSVGSEQTSMRGNY
ncbi:MAG TPA: hypothetical protein PKY82_06880 [Pyrinomonadaceae bacterium]|nr:hypothetical protein [Pyrinomonadaceae bacterium]